MRARLEVTPIEGEIFRFLVASQQGKEVPPYLVDLQAMNFCGWCACPHYEHRLYALNKAQEHLTWDKIRPIRCIHIIDASEFYQLSSIHLFTEHMKKIAEEKRAFGISEPERSKHPETFSGLLQRFFNRKKPESK